MGDMGKRKGTGQNIQFLSLKKKGDLEINYFCRGDW